MQKKRASKVTTMLAAGYAWKKLPNDVEWHATKDDLNYVIKKVSDRSYDWTVTSLDGKEIITSGSTLGYAFWDAADDIKKIMSESLI
ncbi:hypothetical protein PP301_gp059 [Gordonia phage GMA2]|uniref:Uncharacterized protein n=1 Tax=Gordonia phage GMA2 TaxID=1647283 RepID=A0A0K0N7D1_9CAUD|nr:hypothetical protein PP301_gp059 [Gordonia phage GMA2]AKJ72663.1 hypothetical protein GMA2_125 [Gordonia phage GMA2]